MGILDRTGRQYGRLTAQCWKKKRGMTWWKCLCECGNTSWVIGLNLRDVGGTRSCGCSKTGNPSHGLTGTPEYSIWKGMRKRCNNPKEPVYRWYGGRGIKVCKRWDSFENFLADMGKRPTPKHSIDRIDNDLGYSTQNCRWATQVEQRQNRSDSIRLTYQGETHTPIEWAKKLGISYDCLRGRICKKLPIHKILYVGDLRTINRR